jgi:hypothetical protein
VTRFSEPWPMLIFFNWGSDGGRKSSDWATCPWQLPRMQPRSHGDLWPLQPGICSVWFVQSTTAFIPF